VVEVPGVTLPQFVPADHPTTTEETGFPYLSLTRATSSRHATHRMTFRFETSTDRAPFLAR